MIFDEKMNYLRKLFDRKGNKLTSLDGVPTSVSDKPLDLSDNSLKTLDGAPTSGVKSFEIMPKK